MRCKFFLEGELTRNTKPRGRAPQHMLSSLSSEAGSVKRQFPPIQTEVGPGIDEQRNSQDFSVSKCSWIGMIPEEHWLWLKSVPLEVAVVMNAST